MQMAPLNLPPEFRIARGLFFRAFSRCHFITSYTEAHCILCFLTNQLKCTNVFFFGVKCDLYNFLSLMELCYMSHHRQVDPPTALHTCLNDIYDIKKG